MQKVRGWKWNIGTATVTVSIADVMLWVLSYITGMLGKCGWSDALLIVALCLTDNLLVWLVRYRRDTRKIYWEKLIQTGIIAAAGMFLAIAVIVYRGREFSYDVVSILVIVSSVFGVAVCGYGLFRSGYSLQRGIAGWLRKNRNALLICIVFIVLSASEIVSISQWDATFYMSGLDNFITQFDLTFKTITSADIGGHLSTGYSLTAGIWHMLINYGNIGVKLCNIFLGCIAIICFYRLLKRYGTGEAVCTMGTLIFAVSPMFLGTIGVISVDYALMVFFIIFFYCYEYGRERLALFSAVLFLFTKETSIVIYFFFWLGILLCRLFSGRVKGRINWRKMLRCFTIQEWLLIIAPTALFLISFIVRAAGGIGWPGVLVAGKEISATVILAGVVGVAAFLWIFKCWIALYYRSRRKKIVAALPLLVMVLLLIIVLLFPQSVSRLVITDATIYNRFGLSASHAAGIFKQAYILNFSWILVLLAGIGFVRTLRHWKRLRYEKKEMLVAVLFADAGIILFSLFYVTYQNPRYLQLHYLILVLLTAVLWRDIWQGRYRRVVLQRAVAGALAVLIFTESFFYIDPLTRISFYSRDIGYGVICGGDTDKLGVVSSCSSDRVVSNRVYTYYLKNFVKFLKDIGYDGSQTILFPKISNWVIAGRHDISTMDKELKCMVPYEGTIADSVHMIKKPKDIQQYITGYNYVYYVDIGMFDKETDKQIEELYGDGEVSVYTTGSWSITVYLVGQ